ncbi:MAG: 4Fe-4S binding protein, partial [bacterium]
DILEKLGNQIKTASLCGLGQTAPNPVLTAIKYFRDEYEAHIKEKRCPAHQCKALIRYFIIPEKCTGCHLCFKVCPVKAISGKTKEIHIINEDICTRCGACYEVCKFDAIVKD